MMKQPNRLPVEQIIKRHHIPQMAMKTYFITIAFQAIVILYQIGKNDIGGI